MNTVVKEWVLFPLFRIISKGAVFMSKAEEMLEKIAEPVLKELGVYLYETEYKKEGGNYFLRLYIDKEGGVTIEDCENVSRAVNPLLDENDFIKEAYIFEVSSPGIDRVLSRPWHYEKAIGQDIDIKLFAPIEGTKEICAKLLAFDGKVITVDYAGKQIEIEKKQAASVRLAFNF